METIRVMVVEDHPLFRQGLHRIIAAADDMELVAELSDGGGVLEQVRQLDPDVIVMDVNLPTQNGLQVTREIKSEFSDTAVVILTAYHDEEQMFHAIRCGASAYYAKDVSPDVLLRAMREVEKGYYVIRDEVMTENKMASWLLRQFKALSPSGEIFNEDMFNPLSPREMEILIFITKGYSNKEVAYRLGISRQTVKNHVTAILRKLDVNDRTQAAVYALRHGWIRLLDTRYDST
ncbi:MAG: response regulator [Ardenticatenaceae bacterium]